MEPSRRQLIKSITAAAVAGAAQANDTGGSDQLRREECYRLRRTAAAYERAQALVPRRSNGDEVAYPNGTANFSKSLPHNALGEPERSAYDQLLAALSRGTFEALEAVPLAGAAKLSNPLAAEAFELEGPDSHQLGMPSAPNFAGAEQAGELVELYWQALTRDIPFLMWEQDETIAAATADLNARRDFRGPRTGRLVTSQTLFRLGGTGVCIGPHISQFLLLPVPYGMLAMEQSYPAAFPDQSFGTNFYEWLGLQNGSQPALKTRYDVAHYICTPRHLAEFVHRDFTFQAFLNAALILSSFGAAALSDTNPYKSSRTQTGFATFGSPHMIDCMARVTNASLKGAWFQKWQVHRRLRPEEFAGRVPRLIDGEVGDIPCLPISFAPPLCSERSHATVQRCSPGLPGRQSDSSVLSRRPRDHCGRMYYDAEGVL